MSNLPASHYAEIYRFRIRNAEKGVTTPSPAFVAQARILLEGLEKIEPTTKVTLEQVSRTMVFKESDSGRAIGRLDYEP